MHIDVVCMYISGYYDCLKPRKHLSNHAPLVISCPYSAAPVSVSSIEIKRRCYFHFARRKISQLQMNTTHTKTVYKH